MNYQEINVYPCKIKQDTHLCTQCKCLLNLGLVYNLLFGVFVWIRGIEKQMTGIIAVYK